MTQEEDNALKMKDTSPAMPGARQQCDCKPAPAAAPCKTSGLEMLPLYRPPVTDEPCCGPPAGPPSSPDERPGYTLCAFVETFIPTPAGPVPRVKTVLDRRDRLGGSRVRLGFGRSDYKVAPGLYAVGRPDADAPVLVTANYKLTFDHLRVALAQTDVWILVLDTRGINVWCAAGKGSFGTEELVYRVQRTALSRVVRHRRLILPQLGATGVAGHLVRKACGFEVVWGPVRVEQIKAFLAAGQCGDATMRAVTFTLRERLVLVPVEISLLRKHVAWSLAAMMLLSGIGPSIFSWSAAWQRGLPAAMAMLAGVAAGCVVVPFCLPWLPGRAFALKGTFAGGIVGGLLVAWLWANPWITPWAALALLLMTTAVSSFLAMNFTGATPFTSPSGVEREMRRAIPLQAAAMLLAVGLWIGAAFQ